MTTIDIDHIADYVPPADDADLYGLTTAEFTIARFANPWHDEEGKFAPKGTGTKSAGADAADVAEGATTKYTGDAAEATQRARDAAAQGLPSEDFDGPLVHRGISIPLTDEQRTRFLELLNSPMTPEEFNQHLNIGPELIEQALQFQGHQGAEQFAGLGRHWTTEERVAETLVQAPGNILIKITAKPRQSDIEAQEMDDGTIVGERPGDFSSGEREVRLSPRSPVDIRDVQISWGDNKWQTVWGEDHGAGAGAAEFERHNYTAREVMEFANPWHDEIGRFAPKGSGRKFGGETVDAEESDAAFAEKYGNERRSGEGNCFETAATYILHIPRDEEDRYRVVHGVVRGQGPVEGIYFDHAWVERSDPLPPGVEDRFPPEQLEMLKESMVTVIDKSNGNDVELPRALYYSMGHIDKRDVTRYTVEEAKIEMLRTEVYGPWK